MNCLDELDQNMNGMSRTANLDLDLLRSFVHIAETGSFTRAGEIVGRTQSAVSMQVRRLETLIGKALLVRGKGGMVRLTPDGSYLLGYAQEMLELNDSVWAVFQGKNPSSRIMQEDYALPIKAQREAFTAQVMVTLLTNEKFSEANALIMSYVENNILVDPLEINRQDDDLIMSLLSMLEYISINFLSNSMDRNIILKQRKSGLLKTYGVLHKYIAYKRQAWGRPNAYRSFEEVVRNYISIDTGLSDYTANGTASVLDGRI
jgi:molybdenum-dependent DNA-binding transcriptional regulator ModE